jgi:hypothetical protein
LTLDCAGVTLNFRTQDDASEVLSVSTLLAEVFDEFPPTASA